MASHPTEDRGGLAPAAMPPFEQGGGMSPVEVANAAAGTAVDNEAVLPVVQSVKEQNRRMLYVLTFAVLAYGSVSLSVVYFNWWLFTTGFKYPVFISWLQQVIGFGIFNFGAKGGQYFSSWRAVFPPAAFDRSVIQSCVPLSISFVLTIGLSNICLQKTLLSTYQVARSLTLLFVILLSYIMLREKQTPLVLFSCGLLVAGFVVGSLDPATLSLGGLLAGGLSSFFQAFYNVLIKYTLPHVGGDNQMLLFYNVMLSSMFFLPMALVCEGFQPFREAFGGTPGVNLWIVWGGIALSGLLGTMLNMTQYLLIQVTTPLTFNMIGFMKALIQSLGGIVFFGDPVSIESGLGLGISTIGSGLYTAAKHRAMKEKEALDDADRASRAEAPSALEAEQRPRLELEGLASKRNVVAPQADEMYESTPPPAHSKPCFPTTGTPHTDLPHSNFDPMSPSELASPAALHIGPGNTGMLITINGSDESA